MKLGNKCSKKCCKNTLNSNVFVSTWTFVRGFMENTFIQYCMQIAHFEALLLNNFITNLNYV